MQTMLASGPISLNSNTIILYHYNDDKNHELLHGYAISGKSCKTQMALQPQMSLKN